MSMTPDEEAARRSVARLKPIQGEKIPRPIRVEILSHGARAVRPLLDVMNRVEGTEGFSLAASGHAATLLGALRAVETIEPLLAAIVDSPEPYAREGATAGLAAFGPVVVEPVLAALGRLTDPSTADARARLIRVLATCEAGDDDRVTQALLGALEESPRGVASFVAKHADPRIADRIEAIFERTTPVDQDSAELKIELGVALLTARRFTDAHGVAMDAAYQVLSRALTDLRAKAGEDRGPDLEDLDGSIDDEDDDDDVPGGITDPGRNEPCWCGSGKKFKRCHGAAAAP
jgi:hypothetical protein